MKSGPFKKPNTSINNYKITLSCLLLVSMLTLFSGCATMDKLLSFAVPSKNTPETAQSLAQYGLDDFSRGKYSKALKKFNTLKNNYPFSEYSLLAELKSADCEYYMNNFPEALALYEEFEERHPTNEAVPYVMYQISMSHYRQLDTIDRDTSKANDSVQAFTRLLRSFPVSPYTQEAQAKIKAARNFLANHEYYVGSFYVRTKSYKEAESRLEYILTQYPDSEIAPEADKLLADLKAGNPPKLSLGSWLPELSMPDWRFYTIQGASQSAGE